jgi:hypothetical protein
MKHLLITFCTLLLCTTLQAQTLKELLKQAEQEVNKVVKDPNISNSISNVLNGNNTNNGGNKPLNNSLVVNGLKEALKIGTNNASGILSKQNGFFGNALIKILMPPEVQNIESKLRALGFNSLCDKLILTMNRAAEDAATKVAPIFINAIVNMSLQDGMGILKGGNRAATDFLANTTTNALTAAVRPVIENSLKKVNATKVWRDVFNTYNRIPLVKKQVNTDLTGYVTQQALKGTFNTVAEEETKIRINPIFRTTDLLKQVFGN